MYSFLDQLNPEHIEGIAALVFMEMLESGYASVGEFHYLHHQQGGQPYENVTETSSRIIAAAFQTGIGLTHLPVFYMQGGLNGEKLSQGQLRFGNNSEQYFRVLEQIENEIQRAPENYMLGMAPHSPSCNGQLAQSFFSTIDGRNDRKASEKARQFLELA